MSETAFILIVDEEGDWSERLSGMLREEGHACLVVHSGREAVASMQSRRPDVILTTLDMAQRAEDREWLPHIQGLAPDAQVVMLRIDEEGQDDLNAYQSPMVQVLGDGHRRPVADELLQPIAEAAERARRNRDNRVLAEQVKKQVEFEGLITGNEQMVRLIKMVRRVADSKLTVLILGQSGTGKELVARAVHLHSPRKDKSYRAINCAGLNENLLESELFGHVKGAFTGAVSERKGLFEAVDGGTLFLDEVGDMPLPMQAKLLRTLENGEIIPVGSNDIRKVDVRVVAATRQDIRAMVEEGQFRDDLFYRLNQAMIRIPPLRDRREDIPLLIDHFLKEAARLHGKAVDTISPETVRRLGGYSWPGNARELKSVINQMVVLSDRQELDVDDLPDYLRGSTDIVLAAAPSTAGLTMEQMEKIHIANTLKLTGGNREKTAKMLGIGARTLYRKLREFGLQ
ncbi:MAG: sigma-54-dependent Fis family transcriptional regulator [Phycisphaerales bacterium]|nr:sigma-54-dependent Fis family transcriptional regulator [Phycisphaerales bacterium]